MSVQLRLPVPVGARKAYPTGLQTPCVACSATGVGKLGMPRDGPSSPALCVPCWRAAEERQEREARRLLRAQLWEGLGTAEDAALCGACGEATPSAACWLCGWSWIAQLRAQFDAEQDAAREAE